MSVRGFTGNNRLSPCRSRLSSYILKVLVWVKYTRREVKLRSAGLWKETRMVKDQNVQPENSSSLKLTYTVKEIAGILGIPIRTAYDFCSKTTDFKVKRMGKTIRIVKKSFDEWFYA